MTRWDTTRFKTATADLGSEIKTPCFKINQTEDSDEEERIGTYTGSHIINEDIQVKYSDLEDQERGSTEVSKKKSSQEHITTQYSTSS